MPSTIGSATQQPQKQTAKEVIAANVQALIEQLEQGKSEALLMPIEQTFFAFRFGQGQDRFGVNKMIIHERPMPQP